MTVQELIDELNKVEDKNADVSIITNRGEDWHTIEKLVYTDSFGLCIGAESISKL